MNKNKNVFFITTMATWGRHGGNGGDMKKNGRIAISNCNVVLDAQILSFYTLELLTQVPRLRH